jgi:hypothetical protein
VLTPKNKILAWIVGSAVLTIVLIGCDAKSLNAGRKEYPDYLPAVVFTADDKVTLAPAKLAAPATFAKVEEVHRQWVGMHAERRKQLELAVKINREQLIDLGRYTKDEANAAVRAHLQQHGYPPDDPIFNQVK